MHEFGHRRLDDRAIRGELEILQHEDALVCSGDLGDGIDLSADHEGCGQSAGDLPRHRAVKVRTNPEESRRMVLRNREAIGELLPRVDVEKDVVGNARGWNVQPVKVEVRRFRQRVVESKRYLVARARLEHRPGTRPLNAESRALRPASEISVSIARRSAVRCESTLRKTSPPRPTARRRAVASAARSEQVHARPPTAAAVTVRTNCRRSIIGTPSGFPASEMAGDQRHADRRALRPQSAQCLCSGAEPSGVLAAPFSIGLPAIACDIPPCMCCAITASEASLRS